MITITHVAVRYEDRIFSMLPPNRHHNILHTMHDQDVDSVGTSEQGFLDSTGQFLNRLDAMKVASEAGQLIRPEGEKYYQGPELFSEDLW